MIHIQTQHIETDRYSILSIHYPDPYDNVPSGNVIPLSYITNAGTMHNGTNMFELMREYHEHDRPILKKISDNEYTIDFRIVEVRKKKKQLLRKYVNRIVLKHFPVVTQVRYMKFMELHEKASPLTTAEQYAYDIELHGRTEQAVWNVVSASIKWLYDVYNKENLYIDTINNTTNLKTLLQLSVNDITLPVWTGG